MDRLLVDALGLEALDADLVDNVADLDLIDHVPSFHDFPPKIV